METLSQQIINGLRRYMETARMKRGVLGMSGGVDSALTLKLAADALGAENVAALIMPELGVTRQENIDHAKALCEFLGVKFFYQPINNFLQDYKNLPWKPNELATLNTKARARMILLYNYANTERALVMGTSNKSEMLLGYGTKYGDFAADVEVIGALSKTEVYMIAEEVGIPPEIISKKPTAELSPGQTDEEDLGAPYIALDMILKNLSLGERRCIEKGMSEGLVHSVFRRVRRNKHKTQLPHVISVKK